MSSDDWLPVVEALYHYESTNARGHSVIVQPGEMYHMIREVDEDWWFVGRSQNDEDGFFFPRSYGKVIQRQQHRMSTNFVASNFDNNDHPLSVSADSAILGGGVNSTTTTNGGGGGAATNRLSTFGGGGSANLKRRSYQLATITDNQLAIYDNPVALLTADRNDIEQQQPSDSTTTMQQSASSMIVGRKPRGPGFKLADPNRISRSIPVDLNFVHIPNENGGVDTIEEDDSGPAGRIVSFYGESMKNNEEAAISMERDIPQKPEPFDQNVKKLIDGPIYANVKPMGTKELPPLPVPGCSPINFLHGGWAEYVDKNNRHYFYNADSKKAMWKPPRLAAIAGGSQMNASIQGSMSSAEDLDTSFISDDGEGLSGLRDVSLSTSIISTAAADSQSDYSSGGPFAVGLSSSLNSSITAPPPIDIRALAAKKHLSIVPESPSNGDQKSVHEGPAVAPSNNREVDVYAYSEDLANIATKLRSSTEDPSPTSEYPNSTLGRGGTYGQGQTQNYVRYGVLYRCKYMEAGKRVKKQWLSCFAYLTNAHLIFYKDEKAAEKKGNQYPTPLGVCDLRGAKLRWLEGDVSRKKNVFEVHLLDLTVYLFHAENQVEVNGWYEDLREVIDQLPIPDCYPTPQIEANSPTRFSIRKPGTSKGSVGAAPELPKHPVVVNAAKDADKRKSVTFGQLPAANQSIGLDSSEIALQKDTILEKLRKFFRSRPSVESLKERGIYKAEPVFGSSLIEICRREKTTIPKFIITCTALIEEKGLNSDGLYRINGNLSQVQRIRCQVDQEKYNFLLNETDVHVLTGALKLFFRELQEPAFPTTSTKDFLNAIRLNDKPRLKAFSELILKLPRPHHDTLDHLFLHLLNVATASAKNRMQAHNLAIVFGPSLFSSNPSVKSAVEASKKATKKKAEPRSSIGGGIGDPKSSNPTDVTHSNSQLAFTMILQGQIVEYLLTNHGKLFKSTTEATGE